MNPRERFTMMETLNASYGACGNIRSVALKCFRA